MFPVNLEYGKMSKAFTGGVVGENIPKIINEHSREIFLYIPKEIFSTFQKKRKQGIEQYFCINALGLLFWYTLLGSFHWAHCYQHTYLKTFFSVHLTGNNSLSTIQ